jgi:hypothetical protein
MIVRCERCKCESECRFHGFAADVGGGKAQNGEWLCEDCVEPRAAELDEAIAKMKKFLGHGDAKSGGQ